MNDQVAKLLDQLNPAQREAVSFVEGPALVVAGAGSGKTRVITYRIPYLILSGAASASQILALTFTNKAAGEMKHRIRSLADAELHPLISTFHAFGSLFLRKHSPLAGFGRDFQVYDEEDQLGMVKECCRELNLPENRYEAKDIQYFIKWQRTRSVPPEIYDSNIRQVMDLYERKKRDANGVDFDDLLILPLRILTENPELCESYRERFRFVMVDEYQDTNEIQYELLKVLVGPRANLLVVGDGDQSIYKFRGARTENMQHFLRDFAHARVIKLEQNYRSTKTIIKAAQAVISNNSSRIKKELWTENHPGEPIEVYHASDEYDEATFVTLRVMGAIKQSSPSDVAVLYRINAQSRVLEESFGKAQIPHRIVGGVGFYERREVKDAVAFLRLLSNKNDPISFTRIVNVPPRGVGKKMMEQIQQEALKQNRSLYEAALDVGGKQLQSFLSVFESPLAVQTPSHFLEELLQSIRYEDYLRKEDATSADERIANISEFLSYLKESEKQEGFDLGTFLGELPLQSRMDDSQPAVTLLTVHSAKGLEFRHLFVMGMEEGLFPHSRALESKEDVEEERRLFYVAMTRAKEALTVSWTQRRGMSGGKTNRPSRFLEEIPSFFKVNKISERFREVSFSQRPAVHYEQRSPVSDSPARKAETPTGCEFRVGGIVRHEKLGKGTVLNIEGAPNDWKLTIRFRESGVKTILTKYAQLQIE